MLVVGSGMVKSGSGEVHAAGNVRVGFTVRAIAKNLVGQKFDLIYSI